MSLQDTSPLSVSDELRREIRNIVLNPPERRGILRASSIARHLRASLPGISMDDTALGRLIADEAVGLGVSIEMDARKGSRTRKTLRDGGLPRADAPRRDGV